MSGGKLYELPKPPPTSEAPDPDIVHLAEVLLKMAKAGELRGLGVAIERTDGTPSIALAFAHNMSICLMLGAIDKLHKRVDQLSDAQGEDED